MIGIQKSRSIIFSFLAIFSLHQQTFCMEFSGNFSYPTASTLSTFDYIKFFVPPTVLAIGVLIIGIRKSCEMCKKEEAIKVRENMLNKKEVFSDYGAIILASK